LASQMLNYLRYYLTTPDSVAKVTQIKYFIKRIFSVYYTICTFICNECKEKIEARPMSKFF
jgi:hypothetical protein